jgi:hypothetical protein
MVESVTQKIARFQLEMQNLHAQLQAMAPKTKDLSLAALIPKLSGMDKTPTTDKLFRSIEPSARIGNWAETDKRDICVLKRNT